ncbi:hypothetical protein PVAG01_07730 [Phlyctema vagabunda]|uniref:Uncharacterized protein n=1 Tax=Phlyctema vagabunda TaxID=108571 RepID=A0ABR4PD90_9HELO
MPINLSDHEQRLLAAVISQMSTIPAVDYQKVGDEIGIKYARNVQASFKKVWQKLKGGSNGSHSPSRTPIKKATVAHNHHRSPEPRKVRPARERKKSEKAIQSEHFKAQWPSDDDNDDIEEFIKKEEVRHGRLLFNGTPDSASEPQYGDNEDRGDEYGEDAGGDAMDPEI